MKVKGWVRCGGTNVPVSQHGRYLDWNRVKGDEAEIPTNPWGDYEHFKIGDDTNYFVIDWFQLPDEDYIVEVGEFTGKELIHPEDKYNRVAKEDAMRLVFDLTNKILDCLDSLDTEHDEELHHCDPWYCMRALGRELELSSYVGQDDNQLRNL